MDESIEKHNRGQGMGYVPFLALGYFSSNEEDLAGFDHQTYSSSFLFVYFH